MAERPAPVFATRDEAVASATTESEGVAAAEAASRTIVFMVSLPIRKADYWNFWPPR